MKNRSAVNSPNKKENSTPIAALPLGPYTAILRVDLAMVAARLLVENVSDPDGPCHLWPLLAFGLWPCHLLADGAGYKWTIVIRYSGGLPKTADWCGSVPGLVWVSCSGNGYSPPGGGYPKPGGKTLSGYGYSSSGGEVPRPGGKMASKASLSRGMFLETDLARMVASISA